MSLHILGTEGFDSTNAAWQAQTDHYDVNTGVTVTGHRSAPQALSLADGNDEAISWAIPNSLIAGIGFWLYKDLSTIGNFVIFRMAASAGDAGNVIGQASGNNMIFRRDHRAGPILHTEVGVLPASIGDGAYFTIWTEIDNTAGKIKVWKDGAVIIDAAGLDTDSQGIVNTIRLGDWWFGGNPGIHIDDVVWAWADSWGDIENLDPLYDPFVEDQDENRMDGNAIRRSPS